MNWKGSPYEHWDLTNRGNPYFYIQHPGAKALAKTIKNSHNLKHIKLNFENHLIEKEGAKEIISSIFELSNLKSTSLIFCKKDKPDDFDETSYQQKIKELRQNNKVVDIQFYPN